MSKTTHKWFWVWNFEKEEKWLNEMSSKGLRLINVGFCSYDFKKSLADEDIVRMQYLENYLAAPKSQEYIKFVEETGAKYIGGFGRWAYFAKENDGNGFEIFSDIDSRIKAITNLVVLIGILEISQMSILISNLMVFFDNPIGYDRTSILVFLCCTTFLMCYGFMRMWWILSKLKKERKLHE